MPGAPPLSSDTGILLGVVLDAHGLKGEVKVKTFTDSPTSVGAYGPVTTGDGRQFLVVEVRPTKTGQAVLRLKGISDRNSAESLKGQRLYVPRAALPEPEDDEYYHADLLGLSVEDEAGTVLGTVKGIHNFGAGDVVEIEMTDGSADFVPFTEEFVPVVDLKGKRIVVVPPQQAK